MGEVSLSARVLVVDDCECNRKLLGAILRHRHIAFDEATNGLEALGKLETGSYELVFMDIQMPIMDGFAAARAYKTQNQENPVPIIAITASTGDLKREVYQDAGFSQKLHKPFAIAEIHTILEQHSFHAA